MQSLISSPRHFALASTLTTLIAGASHADVLSVPGEYATPQDAVSAALPGDRIEVAPGTYGPVTLDVQDVTLAALGSGTVIDGMGGSFGILVTASGAAISDFELRNATVGIDVQGPGSTVSGNQIRLCGAALSTNSTGGTFERNHGFDNVNGFVVLFGSGNTFTTLLLLTIAPYHHLSMEAARKV